MMDLGTAYEQNNGTQMLFKSNKLMPQVKHGITPWMPADHILQQIAQDEHVSLEEIEEGIRDGTLIVLASRISSENPDFKPISLGRGVRKKIAAAIGMSPQDTAHISEVELNVILDAKPDIVSDVSIGGPIVESLRWLREHVKVPLGSCPTYDIIHPSIREPLSKEQILDVIGRHLMTGIDFILLHIGIDFELFEKAYTSKRIIPVTSRGGGLIIDYMNRTGDQNPFLTYLDDILALLREYQVVLDIGDVFRPGCLYDADDELKVKEAHLLRRIRGIAMNAGVQVLCESGGHIPFHMIPSFITRQKKILGQAPLWLIGPLPLDRGIGRDSLLNAIGISLAAQYGGDLFLSVTDVEHFSKPNGYDIANSIKDAKVALAVANCAMQAKQEIEKNRDISQARQRMDWLKQAELSLFPEMSLHLFQKEGLLESQKPCKMCGEYCPLTKFTPHQS